MKSVNFAKKSVVVAAGDSIDHVYIVKEGELKAQTLALILDKYYWVKTHGESVLYGSQFGKPCLKQRKITDSARAVLGLRPLKLEDLKECN